MVDTVFEPIDADWRGIGVIPGTGLGIREEFAAYDATKRFTLELPEPKEIKGCQCGEVLRGITLPFECKLFARGCTPEHPIGPCMVSSEGSCAAYYRFTDYGRTDSVAHGASSVEPRKVTACAPTASFSPTAPAAR